MPKLCLSLLLCVVGTAVPPSCVRSCEGAAQRAWNRGDVYLAAHPAQCLQPPPASASGSGLEGADVASLRAALAARDGELTERDRVVASLQGRVLDLNRALEERAQCVCPTSSPVLAPAPPRAPLPAPSPPPPLTGRAGAAQRAWNSGDTYRAAFPGMSWEDSSTSSQAQVWSPFQEVWHRPASAHTPLTQHKHIRARMSREKKAPLGAPVRLHLFRSGRPCTLGLRAHVRMHRAHTMQHAARYRCCPRSSALAT